MGNTALTSEEFDMALTVLGESDTDICKILKLKGKPPFWVRNPGFPTLVKIILEQQVSLASAKAAYDRLVEKLGILTPEVFLELDDVNLKRIGFSRQKTRYCRNLAKAVSDGTLVLGHLVDMDNENARAELTKITGIGMWTADIYLLMALRRPDIWPIGDIALYSAVQHAKGLNARPNKKQFVEIGEQWRPWRAVAARVLWHFYLSGM